MTESTTFSFTPNPHLKEIYDNFKNKYPKNSVIYGWINKENNKWGITGNTKYNSITGTGHNVQYINHLISRLLEEEQHFENTRIERAWLNLIESYEDSYKSDVSHYTNLPLKATLPIGKLNVFQIGRAHSDELGMITLKSANVSEIIIESKSALDEALDSIDCIIHENIKTDFKVLMHEFYKNEPYRPDWLKENGTCKFIQSTFNIGSSFDLIYYGWKWEGVTRIKTSDRDAADMLYSGIIINTSKLVNDPDNEPLFEQLVNVCEVSTAKVN
ncbi:hypothetical protein [Pseudomonas phage ANB1]|nr:hypothetical protein [Pseudomonas phage ANB1]